MYGLTKSLAQCVGKEDVLVKNEATALNRADLMRGGNPNKMLPISFVIYLIQDKGRNILVDTGCNDCAGFEMIQFSKPVEILKQYGVMLDAVTDVVITHHHHNHIAAIKDYPNATVYIQKEEYELGKNYIPNDRKVVLFDRKKILSEDLIIKLLLFHDSEILQGRLGYKEI